MPILSDLVDDFKLLVRFSAEYTYHDVFESDSGDGQLVRRRRKEEKWRKGKHLGEGSFGAVWLEQCLSGDSQAKFRAVKMVPKVSPFSQVVDYTRELEAIAKFSLQKVKALEYVADVSQYNGFFVRSSGWYEDVEHVFIAMEYFEQGDLQKHLGRPLPERECKQITHQLLEGLEQLHVNGFAHRDLKPANIFVVRSSPNWWVKIGDFGISKRVNDESTFLRTAVGTPGFVAPEVLESDEPDAHYDYKVDIWSLGVIAHYAITTTLPFREKAHLRSYLQDSFFPTSALISQGVSLECRDFIIKGLLAATATSRLSASDALRHQWLEDFCASHTTDINTTDLEGHSSDASASPKSTDASAKWSAPTGTEYQDAPLMIGQTNRMEGLLSSILPSPNGMQDQNDALWHSHTGLEFLYQAGSSFYQLKQFKEAEAMFHRALQGQEKVLGYDHADTTNSAHWRGRCFYQLERFEEAHAIFHRALQRQKKMLGHDHTDTSNSAHWLGRTLHQLKRYDEAENVLHRALKGQEKVLGHDHADTINSAHWLGHSLYQLKRYDEAENVLHRALKGQEKVLGHDHADTINSAHWLGHSLYQLKRYEEAENILHRALKGQEKVLGHDHADTINSAHWLGLSRYHMKQYKEAEDVLRQSLQGQEKVLGLDHADTLKSAHWLGQSLFEQNRYKEAEAMLRQALTGQEKVLGHDHADTLESAHWLGQSICEQKRYKEAEKMLGRSLQGRKQVLGQDDANTLLSAEWLGKSLYGQQQYKEAEIMFHHALQRREKIFGRDHPSSRHTKALADKAYRRTRFPYNLVYNAHIPYQPK
ncbi:hypothetical protein N7474_006133 [Penicillium riverlandense]|uniref:uncharacterized protein n=1 Tax=Penicillium riverlandense TaxID=1903569 RepID=UPI00254816D9|nr:uncharacterized protein N7474_006133 [Penicillium riverlandense]KAJ5820542.1 hypothetical protein N7474_006133 [Penicillium riverlandense]